MAFLKAGINTIYMNDKQIILINVTAIEVIFDVE